MITVLVSCNLHLYMRDMEIKRWSLGMPSATTLLTVALLLSWSLRHAFVRPYSFIAEQVRFRWALKHAAF